MATQASPARSGHTPAVDSSHAVRAYDAVREGGVVLLPTDVGFGLIACTDAAIARIYELKGRPSSKPCVTVANAAILEDLAEVPGGDRMRSWIDRVARRAPIALVNRVRGESQLLAGLSDYARGQVTTAGTIATFLNAGLLVSIVAELALLDGRIVAGSSANTAFTGNNYDLDDVPESIRNGVDLVIPGARARYAHPRRIATTILDMTRGEFIRQGIEFEMIAREWEQFRAA